MIITNCPYRVSFFGGGTDFPNWYNEKGCNIISCSIDAFCYVTIRKLLPFYGNNYRISWSEIEEVNNIKSINHPAIKGALKYLDIKSGLEIHTDGDLPARSGLGSSSSFSAALLLALNTLKGKKISINDLTKNTIFFEQEILKENVGIQDQIQTCNGGFNLISINKKGEYRILRLDVDSSLVKEISSKMMLLYTGHKRISSHFQDKSQKINSSIRKNSLQEISKISDKVTSKILNEDINFNEFSDFIQETWSQKLKLFPTSNNKSKIMEIFKKAKKAGAISGKLLGAGGGGFFLFFVEEHLQDEFKKKMKNYTVVKHQITNSPCKIIFNSLVS